MQHCHSEHFKKHKRWCGTHFVDHEFKACVYNPDRVARKEYFRAPCCGRFVRFLVWKNTCKKCLHYSNVRCQGEEKNHERVSFAYPEGFEPQGLFSIDVNHKISDVGLDNILQNMNASFAEMTDDLSSKILGLLGPVEETVLSFVVKATVSLALLWRVRDDTISVVLSITQFLLSIGVGSVAVNLFKDYISHMVQGMQAQSPDLESMFCVVGFFLSLVALGSAPNMRDMLGFFRNVCSLRHFTSGCSTIISSIKSCIIYAVDFITQTFLGYSISWHKEEAYDAICNWCDNVRELHTKSTKDTWTYEMINTLDDLNDGATTIQNYWRVAKPPVHVLSIYQTHTRLVRDMLEEVAVNGVRQIPRIEPMFIMLQGPTAYGKSTIVPLLATDLIKNCMTSLPGKVWSSYVYNRTAETDFWDGYTGQQIIVYDDFGQKYDTMMEPNKELMEIIRLGNSAPFFPNMARLEQKGRTRIASDFVIMTSNSVPNTTSVNSLKEPSAVMRRIDFMVKVQVTDDVLLAGTNVVDYDLVGRRHASGTCGCDIDRDVEWCLAHYRFSVFTWVNEEWKQKDTPMIYNEFVRLVTTTRNEKKKKAASRIDFINQRLGREADLQTPVEVATTSTLTPQMGGVMDNDAAREMREQKFRGFMTRFYNSTHQQQRQLLAEHYDQVARWFQDPTMDQDLIDNANAIINKHLFLVDFADFEPQGNFEDCETLVGLVKEGDNDAMEALEEWLSHMPSDSCTDWADMIDKLRTGEWNAMTLDCICQQMHTELPKLKTSKTSLRGRLEAGRVALLKNVARLNSKPFFFLFMGLGAAAIAGLFSHFVYPLFKEKDAKVVDIGEMVRIRQVGDTIKSSFMKSPAIKVDETAEELYIRVDKGRFLLESSGSTQYSTGDNGYAKQDKRTLNRQHFTSRSFIPHSYEDPSIADVEKVALKNMVLLYDSIGESLLFCGHGIMVKGRVCLTFAHLFARKITKLVVKRLLTKQTVVIDTTQIKSHQLCVDGKAIDALMFELPREWPLARDITSHFAETHEIGKKFFSTRLISARGIGDEGLVRISSGVTEASDEVVDYSLLTGGVKEVFFVRNAYKHRMDTLKGDCGAILVQANTACRGKILGIHVAGGARELYNIACPVFKEQVDECLTHFSAETKLAPTMDQLTCASDDVALHAQMATFDIICEVEQGVSDAVKSQCKHSPLAHVLGKPKCAAAVLNGTVDEKDVKISAIFKKNTPRDCLKLDGEILNQAVEETKRRFVDCNQDPTSYWRYHPLTIEQAVFGEPSEKYMPSIIVDSSSGYPWSLTTTRKGKRDFIDLDRKWIDARVVRAVKERVERAQMDQRTTTIYVDHLKDERRPIEGQKYLKPRLFSGGPIDFTIAFRQYFGGFLAFVLENRIDNTSAVGINVHGMEWQMLANYLHETGDSCLAGDFVNYDGTLDAQIIWRMLDVVNSWYADGNNGIRTVLFAEIVNATHLFRNTVYATSHGNPSGNPMTTVLNSMYQYAAWAYVVLRMGHPITRFVKSMRLITYGDDHVLSVQGSVLDPGKVVEGFKELGMVLTAEDKVSQISYKRLDEISFLKRTFRYENTQGRYLAPLPLWVLEEMVMWYNGTGPWLNVAQDIIECSVRECAHHDDDTFQDFTTRLRKAMQVIGHSQMCVFERLEDYRSQMLKENYISSSIIV